MKIFIVYATYKIDVYIKKRIIKKKYIYKEEKCFSKNLKFINLQKNYAKQITIKDS